MSNELLADPVAEYVTGHEFRMLIGGDLVRAADSSTFDTIDPSTGNVLASVPAGGAADVARAVEAAAAAQPEWEAIGLAGRSEAFAALGRAIVQSRDRLAMLDAMDGGMPFQAMRMDVSIALSNVAAWPELVRWHGGRLIPASPGNLHYTAYKPYGVVGKIIPFNHPVMFAISGVLGPLIAGNTVVLKHAQQTPLSGLALGEIVREVLPPGVLNIVSGGPEAGDALVTHPAVKRLAFTGSVPTGMKIQQRAAGAGVKAVSLELGGKNPMIVFPDVDVEQAVSGALIGMNFGTCSGQSCGSNSRVYVHRDIYEPFLEQAGARLEAMRLGVAYGEDVDMGPLVTEDHYRRVLGYVESGREQGARLITGGDGLSNGGYFLRPTLFADVSAEMAIGREEIFGPVLSVAPWDNYEDVVRQANDTELGLTASVWTRDIDLAHRTADRLEAGYVWINGSARHYFGTPFGGMKASGLGREESIEEYESYLELKVVHTILGDPAAAFERMGSSGR